MSKGEHFDIDIPEQINLGSYFLDVNLELGRGNKTALYYKNCTYSFLDLWVLTNRVGNVLRELGVEPENRVLLVLGDSPEWVATWLATMKIGAVGTHAYTYLNTDDYEYLLALVRPKVVVVDSTTLERIREASRNLKYPKALLVSGENLPDLQPGEFNLQAMLKAADDCLEVEATHKDDLAFWNFSGGTTGKPKGVPHTHRDGVLGYETHRRVLAYRSEDIVLRAPKLFFHYSRDGCLFPLRAGATGVLFEERTTAPLMFDLIRQYRPTVLLNVPTMMRAMIQTPAEERADLSCVRRCMSSGELLSAQLYEAWMRTFGGEVVNRFGSAESAMGFLGAYPGAVVPGSSGQALPLAEVKLVDGDGAEVPRGEVGVLHTRCPSAGLYYVREYEKSKATFLGNDWIDTGDCFTQDENDFFWFVGRANEMVKVSGVWVSPLEIERALQESPEVKECVGLSVQDPDGLIIIKAFVVLKDGVCTGTEASERLKQFCKTRLAPHKFPKAIEFLEELPKGGNGKIDRLGLRNRTWAASTS